MVYYIIFPTAPTICCLATFILNYSSSCSFVEFMAYVLYWAPFNFLCSLFPMSAYQCYYNLMNSQNLVMQKKTNHFCLSLIFFPFFVILNHWCFLLPSYKQAVKSLTLPYSFHISYLTSNIVFNIPIIFYLPLKCFADIYHFDSWINAT